jgi:hypothetical protein
VGRYERVDLSCGIRCSCSLLLGDDLAGPSTDETLLDAVVSGVFSQHRAVWSLLVHGYS